MRPPDLKGRGRADVLVSRGDEVWAKVGESLSVTFQATEIWEGARRIPESSGVVVELDYSLDALLAFQEARGVMLVYQTRRGSDRTIILEDVEMGRWSFDDRTMRVELTAKSTRMSRGQKGPARLRSVLLSPPPVQEGDGEA